MYNEKAPQHRIRGPDLVYDFVESFRIILQPLQPLSNVVNIEFMLGIQFGQVGDSTAW